MASYVAPQSPSRYLLLILQLVLFSAMFFIASDTFREGTIQRRSEMTVRRAHFPGEDADDVDNRRKATPSCWVPNLSSVTTTQRPLPTPVIVLGLPKTGTTSLTAWFRRAKYTASHWECPNWKEGKRYWKRTLEPHSNRSTDYCGPCIEYAIKRGLSPLKYCGNYQFWGQLDVEMPQFGLCAFPQVYNLRQLHDENPNATFILNQRNVTKWIDSLRRWGNMAQRLVKCGLLNSMQDKDLEELYCSQIIRVREFVRGHPSHALVEVDIEDESTGGTLAGLFSRDASLWRQENKGKDKGTERRG